MCPIYISNYKLFILRPSWLLNLSMCGNNLQFAFGCQIHRSAQKKQLNRYIRKPAPREPRKSSLSHSSLINLLQKCKTVAEQIDVFHSSVKLQDEDIILRNSMCSDVGNKLKSYFPTSCVRLVGSSVNSFGLKDCDADLSFKAFDFDHTQVQNTSISSCKKVDIENMTTDDFPNLSPKNQLLFIQKILQRSGFEEPFTVIPGRCPILNFYVKNVNCDLSIHNRSAQHATSLMFLCSKLDQRVAPLMHILSYWAKHSKLVGGPVRFKSYALFLLMLYFLQTRSPSVLPTVDNMFSKTEFMENFNNWSYDVSKYVGKFEPSKNSESIEGLLHEFFFFYGNFDFSWIICTRTGCLKNPRSLPPNDDEENKFEVNTISIQDPLNLNWNVTTQVNWNHCKNFIKSIISVCEIYQDSRYWSPSFKKWGLSSIIDNQFSYETLNFKDVTIEISPNCCAINTHSTKETCKEWALETAKDILNVLDYCLLFHCCPFDSDSDLCDLNSIGNSSCGTSSRFECIDTAKSLRTKDSLYLSIDENVSSLESPSFLICHFKCITADTWMGRNSWHGIVHQDNSKDILEFEHEISKLVYQYRKNKDKEIFSFACECSCISKDNKIVLSLLLKPLSHSKFIPKLGVFLKEYIPKFAGRSLFITKEKQSNIIN